MRRAVTAIAATAGGLVLLANFHTGPSAVGLPPAPTSPIDETTEAEPSTAAETSAPPAPTSAAATIPRPTSKSGAPTKSSTATPRTTGSTPRTTATARPATTASTVAATPATTRTVDGPIVATGYGDVQVEVTVRGKRIVDVQALKLPSDRARSQRISAHAGPILRAEALQAQSANIDAVSGASYTSAGYAQSLQSALDAAGV
jgi:uncharacterized protein with FMN-binding domain